MSLRLAWLLEYDKAPVHVSALGAEPPDNCVFSAVVDALSGELLDAYCICHGTGDTLTVSFT